MADIYDFGLQNVSDDFLVVFFMMYMISMTSIGPFKYPVIKLSPIFVRECRTFLDFQCYNILVFDVFFLWKKDRNDSVESKFALQYSLPLTVNFSFTDFEVLQNWLSWKIKRISQKGIQTFIFHDCKFLVYLSEIYLYVFNVRSVAIHSLFDVRSHHLWL